MEDFAKKYWGEFESLIYLILNDIYKNIDTKLIESTKSKSDGGYDAYVIIPTNNGDKKMLAEAKLRKFSNKDLPLSDFSKTLIIGINLLVDEVFILTNLHFSKGTNERTQLFSLYTGMKIHRLNGNDIFGWMRSHNTECEKISDSFIKEFADNQKTIAHFPKENENFSDLITSPIEKKETLLGEERNSSLDSALRWLINNNGVVLVEGVLGCGKTCFINNLERRLLDKKRIIFKININEIDTCRLLFLELLSFSWGTKREELYKLCLEDFNEILKVIDKKLDDHLIEALKLIFLSDDTTFENRLDIWQSYLLEYLKLILPPLLRRTHPIFIIENLEYANVQVRSFLLKILKCFSENECSFIIESHVSSVVYKEQDLCKIRNLFHAKIDNLTILQCKELLKEKFCVDNANEKIIRICSQNPYYLLQLYPTFSKIESSDVIDEYDNFSLLNNIKIEKTSIDSSIYNTIKGLSNDEKQLIGLSTLLNGKISLKFVRLIYKDASDLYIYNLARTGLYFFDSDYIKIKHISYFHFFKNLESYLDLMQQNKIANLILNYIDILDLDYFLKQEAYLSACMILKRYSEITPKAKDFIVKLIHNNEYAKCLQFVNNILHEGEDYYFESIYVWLYLYKLYCLIYLNKYSNKEILSIISYLNNKDTNISMQERALFINLKCKYYLANGHYDKIIDEIPQESELHKLFIYQEIIWRLGCIALKHLTNKENCIYCLKYGLTLYNDSPILNYTLWSHIPNVTFDEVDKSLAYFEKCIDLYDVLSLEEQLHNENNVAVCNFYKSTSKDDREKCLRKCKNIQSRAFINAVDVEECRAYNTMALISWRSDENEKALKYFNFALDCLEKSFHATHIWPIYINIAILHYEMNNFLEAEKMAMKALYHLKRHYSNAFVFIKNDQPNLNMPKYYIGLLFLLRILWSYDKHQFVKEFAQPLLNRNLYNSTLSLVSSPTFEEFFEESFYLVNNHLMLKI